MKRKIVYGICIIVVTILIGYVIKKYFLSANNIVVNYDSGFYSKNLEVVISSSNFLNSNMEFYYTLDGNDPTQESSKYNSPILLGLKEQKTVYVLKVCAYVDGVRSNIIEKSYVLDSNIQDNDIMIVSITTNDSNLYDYETGIFVKR